MDIFGRNKIKALNETVNSLRLDISESNQFYRAIYQFLNGSALSRDKLSNAVKYGYEGNVSCFGIVNTLSTIFAKPEDKLFLYDKDKSKREVDPLEFGIKFINKPNHYQSWNEFKKTYATSIYVNGNSLSYVQKLPRGNNTGRLLDDQIFIMPAQNVQLYSGQSWKDPLKEYGFDMDGGQIRIQSNEIWHERFAPNLDFTNGKHFWGISPVLVAINIIQSQNEGYEFLANTYKNRMPPGIFSNESEYQEGTTEKQRNAFHETWAKYYQGKKGDQKPVFVNKGTYQKIGFDSMRDLQVLETQSDGSRQLATALGVPSQIFNDIYGTTFNNQQEAFKRLITLRTEADWTTFYEGLNTEIIHFYDSRLYLEPDTSKISELIKNLESIAKVYDIGVRNKSITKNEFREALGLETKEKDGMDDVGDSVLDSFPTLQQTGTMLNDI